MWPFFNESRALCEAKRRQRTERLAEAPKYSASEHGPFLKATASEIVGRIQRGEWTASEVISAYIARAVFAHETTNCVTEVLFTEAVQQAKDLDTEFAATKQLRGPLHGVPISLKDQFDITGYDSTIGFSGEAQKPAESDADIVKLLKAAGAIPIVKTNVPQTMFSFECCNPVFGRTVNPHKPGFTCGGSSGGEAALLAMDGSALGVGSDIGGSLRIPAAFCGIFSFKPGPLRVSYAGTGNTVPGFEAIVSVGGPMGRSVEDLETFCRIAFGVPGRTHNLAPVLYRQLTLPQKLRFGYYSDFYIKASPANKRAVLETAAALRSQGHECIEIEVPDPVESFDVFVGLSSADGYKTLLSGIGSDPLDSSLFVIAHGTGLPRFIKLFAAWCTETFFKDAKFASALRSTGVKPVREYLQWTVRRDKYNELFNSEVWDKHALDGIIAPVQAMPQVPTGSFTTLFSLSSSTVLFNVVNSPAGCIPVTKVDPVKDAITEEWTELPSPTLVERALYFGQKPVYDPVAMKGMPVSVQVVGKKWEDEKVLAMMHVVDSALGKDRGFGPGNWDARENPFE
ncbi:amidase [Mycena maculata]|uniref:amidase n=1 Tax=Mycena maculata TaxID=230809 RepID=A0AAD7ND22_9AGAR|nr:amidase [Mycena maculata]